MPYNYTPVYGNRKYEYFTKEFFIKWADPYTPKHTEEEIEYDKIDTDKYTDMILG